ncbi:hypothetical protein NLG97_g3036 [Lecanicillium saksenae]|uniref:Uncharacterized protein n=1 Tax=Lecanicillium saksenae TaxID=468837 RepID=A0ACC1R2I3_9HYPO|nr:hypothetical protein NLG97_g3036 [Lecanicillium saksenae]
MVLPTMEVYTMLPTNIGPLTTTFTPPATCTGFDVGGRGNEAFFLDAQYLGHVKCSTNVLDECRPLPPTSKGIQDLINVPNFFLTYHSPAVICPSGWSTAASYDRAQPTDVTFRPENYMDRFYKSVWPLEKSETLILCCPE